MFFTNGRNTAVDNTFKLNLYGRHTSIGVRSARNFHTIVIINLVHTFKSFLFFKLSSKLRTIKLTAKLSSKRLKKVSALPKPFCIFCKLSRNKELLNYQNMFQINVRINQPKHNENSIKMLLLFCRRTISANVLRLKKVGAFEVQTFFWKPHFKCKLNFH